MLLRNIFSNTSGGNVSNMSDLWISIRKADNISMLFFVIALRNLNCISYNFGYEEEKTKIEA